TSAPAWNPVACLHLNSGILGSSLDSYELTRTYLSIGMRSFAHHAAPVPPAGGRPGRGSRGFVRTATAGARGEHFRPFKVANHQAWTARSHAPYHRRQSHLRLFALQ